MKHAFEKQITVGLLADDVRTHRTEKETCLHNQ